MNRPVPLLLMAIFGLLAGPHLLTAQGDFSGMHATSSLTAGVQFAGGASMTIDPPEGRKVKPLFAWRLGADATYPLTPVIMANLGFGLDSRGTRLHPPNDADVYTDTRIDYFYLNPGFRFGAFYTGFSFGFPMSANTTTHTGAEATVSSDILETMLEARLGAVITLLDVEPGWLGLSVVGGFALNDFSTVVSTTESQQFVALHLGLGWQFAIPGTSRK